MSMHEAQGADSRSQSGSAVAEKNPGRRRSLDWSALLAVAVGVFYACATLALRQEHPTAAYPVGDAQGGGARQSQQWAQEAFNALSPQSAQWLQAHAGASAQCASAGLKAGKQKPAWALWDSDRAYPWIGDRECPAGPAGQASRWRLGWDAKANAPALWGDAPLGAYSDLDAQAQWARKAGWALDQGVAQLKSEDEARRAREGWQERFAEKSAQSAQKRLAQERRLSDPALATGELSSSASLSALAEAASSSARAAAGASATASPSAAEAALAAPEAASEPAPQPTGESSQNHGR